MDACDLAPGPVAQATLDESGVAECRRHQQELGSALNQQRDLPGAAPVAVAVVVEFVHDHVGGVDRIALLQRHVGEHLGRTADHRGRPVDARIAGQHAHVLGSERFAQAEELFADERLDGCRVEGAASLAEAAKVKPQCHQALARARGGTEHDMPVHGQFEKRFFLGGVGRETRRLHPGEEALEDCPRVQEIALRDERREGARRHGVAHRVLLGASGSAIFAAP